MDVVRGHGTTLSGQLPREHCFGVFSNGGVWYTDSLLSKVIATGGCEASELVADRLAGWFAAPSEGARLLGNPTAVLVSVRR